MSGLRVLHLTTISKSIESLLLDQLLYLQQAGYDVSTASAEGPEVARIKKAGIPHFSIGFVRNPKPWTDLSALRQTVRLLRRERFDIVHTHTPKAALLGQIASRLSGTPLVVNTLHGVYLHQQMSRLQRLGVLALERVGASCADLILSQNREDIELFASEGIASQDRMLFIGNGIDLSRFAPDGTSMEEAMRAGEALGLSRGIPVVGFVGRLSRIRKGFETFCEMANRIHAVRPSVQFLVVGEPDDVQRGGMSLDEIRAALGTAAIKCVFAGWRSNSELPALYARMHALVLPSLFEGLPRAIMEAAAMGVPAVASDVKGNREAVVDGQTGFLTPFGDASALAGRVLSIIEDRCLHARLGMNARRDAIARFDQRRVFEKVSAAYRTAWKGVVRTTPSLAHGETR